MLFKESRPCSIAVEGGTSPHGTVAAPLRRARGSVAPDRRGARLRVLYGLAGPAALAALLPTPAELIAQVQGGPDAIGVLGAAMLLAASVLVWSLLGWGVVVGAAALLARLPGAGGAAGRAVLRILAPAAARRLLIVAAGVSLATGLSACASQADAGPAVPRVVAMADVIGLTGADAGPVYHDGGYTGPVGERSEGGAAEPGAPIDLDWPMGPATGGGDAGGGDGIGGDAGGGDGIGGDGDGIGTGIGDGIGGDGSAGDGITAAPSASGSESGPADGSGRASNSGRAPGRPDATGTGAPTEPGAAASVPTQASPPSRTAPPSSGTAGPAHRQAASDRSTAATVTTVPGAAHDRPPPAASPHAAPAAAPAAGADPPGSGVAGPPAAGDLLPRVRPVPGPAPTGPAADASTSRTATGAASPVTVVVRPGDSLWSIAARHLPDGAPDAQIDSAWRAWYAANHRVIGADPDLILPGQRLVSPTDIASAAPGAGAPAAHSRAAAS